ncbi:hypothetical protein BZF66_05965 [Salmonella enterica]|nr:hypothetical protein [Salmonella enterica]
MPGQFRSKSGATIAGHSDKWSDENRRRNSFNAGQGSRGSRNQGTGAAGQAQTKTDTIVDTSRMKPEEKLKYFQSLGLLGHQEKGSKEPPKAAPQKPMPTDSKSLISTLQDQWKDAFNGDVRHSKRLIAELKDVAPAKIKKALQAAYRATQEITAREDDPLAIVEYISDAIVPFTYED